MNENKLKFYIIKLKNCEIIDSVLFRKNSWLVLNLSSQQ